MGFDETQKEKIELRVAPEEISEQAAVEKLDVPAAEMSVFKKRLKFEVEAVKALSHPGIVRVLGWGEGPDGKPYVSYERIDDPSLFDVMHSKSNLSRVELLGYLVGACQALAGAHAQGVVHRKLSPHKIFVSDNAADGQHVRVGGFGVGWIGDSRKADPRIDVYQFGRIVEDAFAGKPIPPEVSSIIAFCTADHESERYADCSEVLDNLLLVNAGKAPEPPKNRPGQSMMKLPVVAAIVVAAVAATVFICFQMHLIPSQQKAPSAPTAVVQPPPVANDPKASDGPQHQVSPLTPEQAREKYGLNDNATAKSSPNSTTAGLTKKLVKDKAVVGGIAAAAVYKSLSAGEKKKVQDGALKGAVNAATKWKSLDSGTKATLTQKAGGFASKAAGFWKRLPRE